MSRKLELFLFKIILLLVPLNYLFVSVLFKNIGIVKFWKDIILLLLLISRAYKTFKNNNILKPNIEDMCIMTFIFFEGVYFLFAPNVHSAAYVIRVYTEPIIIYILLKSMSLDKEEIDHLKNLIINESVILTLYGIIQALFLGESFLRKIGYSTNKFGRLDTSFYLSGLGGFQRVASTFSSPNTYGFYVSIIFIFLICNTNLQKLNLKIFTKIIILLGGCILSFSRSCWLGIVVTMIYIWVKDKEKIQNIKKLAMMIVMLIPVLIIINNKLEMDVLGNLMHVLDRTVNLEDTSAIGHIQSFNKSISVVGNNIFGTGLGQNGPKARLFISNAYTTESSYFLLMYEFGIIGMIVYMSIIFNGYRQHNYYPYNMFFQKLNMASKSVSLFLLFTFAFLPYIQEMESVIFYYIILALANNRKLSFYNNQNNIQFEGDVDCKIQ